MLRSAAIGETTATTSASSASMATGSEKIVTVARLDARDVEHLVDQLQQAPSRFQDVMDRLKLVLGQAIHLQ